jgi:integrase/recombinase XerD
MKVYVEPDEVALMEEATTNLRDRLLIRMLFHLGCRVSEALALKVEDIDFTQSTLSIVHLKRRVKISCSNCGAGIAVSHSYCPKCGVRINEPT